MINKKAFSRKFIKYIMPILLVIFFLTGAAAVKTIETKNKIKELFRMNKTLQLEGYYTAEFEFKMLGIAYYLSKGKFIQAEKKLNQLHNQLKTKNGLIKIPSFKNKSEELQFYLNLQNEKTGAFMDDSYPYCTYTGPTGNIIAHIHSLAEETGQPLKLKYPLKYIDKINTPEKLTAYFNDVATVSWIAARLPQTSFHFTRDILSLFLEENDVTEHNLYSISPEFKHAMIKWFYDWQDSETGLWGPKSSSGKLRKKDTMNTASIIKVFINTEGNNIYEEFPLRYKNEMCNSFLDEAFNEIPQDNEPDEWHEWNLKIPKTIRTFTRYFWNDISIETKNRSIELMKFYVEILFAKFYVYEEGAFTNFPNGQHAVLDAGGISFFQDIGAFPGERQKKLWGNPESMIKDFGICRINSLSGKDFELIFSCTDVNSIRIYQSNPVSDRLTSGVSAITYPKAKKVLDIMELTPRMMHWLSVTDQSMGNWVSKQTLINDLNRLQTDAVPVYENGIPEREANRLLNKNGKLVLIAFDILQRPRYRIIFEKKSDFN